jgi:hypothetical protein
MDELEELRRAIQALASSGEAQISLFPDFVCVGDEMANDFGDALDAYRRSNPASDDRTRALSDLDAHIDRLAASADDDLWSDPERLRKDPAWERTRELARNALRAFEWPDEVPARNGAVYVAADRSVRNE